MLVSKEEIHSNETGKSKENVIYDILTIHK